MGWTLHLENKETRLACWGASEWEPSWTQAVARSQGIATDPAQPRWVWRFVHLVPGSQLEEHLRWGGGGGLSLGFIVGLLIMSALLL